MQNTQTISTRTASHAVLGVHTKASLRTISLIALAAVAFATAPTAARADNPACGTTGATQEENPVGVTCDNSTQAIEIDSSNNQLLVVNNIVWNNSTYVNNGIFNNLLQDGVKFVGQGGTFTNNGIFNNGLAQALNFSVANGVFVNNGTFNSNAVGGIVFGADGLITNSGTFNDLSGNSFVSNGNAVTFTNAVGGIYNVLGGTIDLGTGTFQNDGTFNIGAGTGAMAETQITGNFIQTSTGILKLRTDWAANTSDKLSVSGTATLAGTLVVTHTNTNQGGSLTRTFNFLTATGGITDNGITVANTATMTNSLSIGANDAYLISTINFRGNGSGLDPNQSQIANQITTAYQNGANLPFVGALLSLQTQAQYAAALSQLGPIGDASSGSSAMKTATTFGNQLLSCKVIGEGDAYAVIREGQCFWTRVTARRTDIDASVGGGHETSTLVSTGAQFNLGGPWRAGLGVAYEEPKFTTDLTSSTGGRMHLGGVIKYNPGPWLFALGVTGGHGWADNTRVVSFGGLTSTATSQTTTNFWQGRFTSAYLMNLGSVYFKPQMDIANAYVSRGAYTEAGTGGIALTVGGVDFSIWSFSPSVEVGTDFKVPGFGAVRPYIKAGATFRDKDTVTTTAAFVGAPGTAFSFATKMDQNFADLGAGVDLIMKGDNSLRLQYDGQFGDTSTQHAGSAKLSIRF